MGLVIMPNNIYTIIEKILKESSPKKIRLHPLFIQYENEICNIFDKTFPQLAHKPNTQKLRLLLNNHHKNLEMNDGVLCRVCNNYRRNDIKQHILNAHNMSTSDYKLKYNTKKLISNKTKNIYSERIKGKKNPAYNHMGKFSPFSTKFVKYSNLDDDTKTKIIKDLTKKRVESTKTNFGFSTTIDYYLTRGYSERKAKEMFRERQNTFSLEKCIQRHGNDEGFRVWKKRQEKWQNTLLQKSQDEINRINQLKGSGINAGYGIQKIRKGFDPNNSICYYIRFFNNEIEFWKIGITNKTVSKRFGKNPVFKQKHNLSYEVIDKIKGKYSDMFFVEQSILLRNKKDRIKIDYNGFSSYECFSTNVLNSKITFTDQDIYQLKEKYEII